MPHLSKSLAENVAAQHGLVTKTALLNDGFTSNTIRQLVTDEVIVRRHSGVYQLATAQITFESRCAAACLADKQCVVTGTAAGTLWCFHHVPLPRAPIVLVGHDRTPVTRGIILRRTNMLGSEDIVHRPDGIRVASPPRAWFDCGRDLDDEKFEMLTEWVLDHHARIPTLWRTLRRLEQRGRPGLARVRRVLSQRSSWQKPADSGLELRVLNALERSGLPELVRQFTISLPDSSRLHPDGALPAIKWAVEIDHVTWHGGRVSAQRDKGRDRRLKKIGWDVERVTDQELRDDFAGTIAEVVQMYHLRREALAA